MNPKNILICRGGALGDLLLTFPLMAEVRRAWPGATIVLAAYRPHSRLAQVGGWVDAVVSLDSAGPAEWFAPGSDLSPESAHFLGSVDLAISFLHDPDGRLVGRLHRAGVQHVVTSSPFVRSGHAIDHFMGVLGELGVPVTGCAFAQLNLPEALEKEGAERVRELGGTIVAIHPGSGSPRKNWPVERFAGLARLISGERKARPIFLLGDAEAPLAAKLAGLCPDVPILKPLDIVALAGFLKNCTAYIGNDSGVTHLAAAVGLPVVTLFGPTDPAMWAPRGAGVQVVRTENATPAALARILSMLL